MFFPVSNQDAIRQAASGQANAAAIRQPGEPGMGIHRIYPGIHGISLG